MAPTFRQRWTLPQLPWGSDMAVIYSVIRKQYTVTGGKLVIDHPSMPIATRHQIDLAVDDVGAPGACPAGTVTIKHQPRGFGAQERQLFDSASPPAVISQDLASAPSLVPEVSTAALIIEWTDTIPADGTPIWVTAVGTD